MKKSLFTYLYRTEDKYYLVHTKNRRVFEVTEKVYTLLSNNDISALMTSSDIDSLLNAEMIVADDLDEVGLLETACSSIDKDEEWHSLHVIPTENCNFGCDYCFVLKDKCDSVNYGVISDENLIKGIDFFFDNNPSNQVIVTFYGGEPLLAPHVIFKTVDYIENVLKHTVNKKIITNASCVTPEIAEFLYKHDFDVNVSLDGTKEAQDAFRRYKNGKSTYADVINGIKLLKNAGNSIKILITVGDFNAPNLEEHVSEILKLEPTTIALNLPKALQINENNIEKNMDYDSLLESYIRCVELCYNVHIPEGHMADIIYGFLRKETQYRPCHGCGKQIALTPSGLIGPCQAYVGTKKYFTKLDYFKDKSELRATDTFKLWKNITMFHCEKCRHCYLLPVCPGDCPYDWENRSGSLLEVPDTYCHSRKLMFDYMIGRLVKGKDILFRPNQREK